jgi:single-strand DNA-binding protein
MTRDPETHVFSSGGKVAQFGFAVNNRKKNKSTGQWEDDPVFIEAKAFQGVGGRKLADVIGSLGAKGAQAYLEGHLVLESWEDSGTRKSKLKVVVDNVIFLSDSVNRVGAATRKSQDGLDENPPF